MAFLDQQHQYHLGTFWTGRFLRGLLQTCRTAYTRLEPSNLFWQARKGDSEPLGQFEPLLSSQILGILKHHFFLSLPESIPLPPQFPPSHPRHLHWAAFCLSFSINTIPPGSRGLVAKPCPALAIPWTVPCRPDSSVHGILQARILEWIAISYSRGIFLTQGLNSCLLCFLDWQVDSLPLSHLGSPMMFP